MAMTLGNFEMEEETLKTSNSIAFFSSRRSRKRGHHGDKTRLLRGVNPSQVAMVVHDTKNAAELLPMRSSRYRCGSLQATRIEGSGQRRV